MNDDVTRLDAVYRAHSGHVFRRARRLLGSDAEAHEVVQDVFLSLLERPEQYAGRAKLTTFLYSVTTHACLNRIRNHAQRTRLLQDQMPDREPEDTRLIPDQRLELHALLRRMPEPLAQAAVYYYADDLSHEDIARILQCSRRHVGDLLARVTAWARGEEARHAE